MSDEGFRAAVESAEQHIPQTTMQIVDDSRKLAALNAARILHPFVEIEPIPTRTRIIVPLANNWRETINIPGGATYCYFTAPAGVPFFVSFVSGIPMPITADPNPENFGDPLVSPIGIKFFCKDFRSVTVAVPDAGACVALSIV